MPAADHFWIYLTLSLSIKLPIFLIFDLYRGWWRYSSVSDMLDVFKATVTAQIIIGIAQWAAILPGFPRSILVIDFLLTLLFLGGGRLLYRFIYEQNFQEARQKRRKSDGRVLIVGAGEAGMALLRQLKKASDFNHEIIGFVDDLKTKLGSRLYGVPVLGNISSLVDIVHHHRISEVYIAIPSLRKAGLQNIINRCIESKVSFKTIPSLREMLEIGPNSYRLREVKVEDLLGREPIHLDKSQTMNDIRGETVLVTGAGGSIGSELARQILKFSPGRIILFERSEYNLFHISRELKKRFSAAEVLAVVGDVLDRTGLEALFREYRPGLVYHAAAHKHVHLMELSPREAIRNNVFGTKNIAEVAMSFEAKKFVMISTDKAVNPLSVMGYSKRLAELVIQSYSTFQTAFISVRFGNVLGSSGSAVEIFRKQIDAGGPVTVTHPDATRFFMTAPEAVELVLHAGSHGHSGHIYMLDMGQPVKVLDLANKMIQLSDPEGKREIKIEITGLWQGEKIQEELYWQGEDFVPSKIEKVFTLKNKVDTRDVGRYLKELEFCLDSADSNVAEDLKQIVRGIDMGPSSHQRQHSGDKSSLRMVQSV